MALVGAQRDDEEGDDAGAAYVYRYDGTEWVLDPGPLVADVAASGALFGSSVSIDGDLALIGARQDGDDDQGAAYIFSWDGVGWTETEKLVAEDADPDDWFGFSVSLSGDVALVGRSKMTKRASMRGQLMCSVTRTRSGGQGSSWVGWTLAPEIFSEPLLVFMEMLLLLVSCQIATALRMYSRTQSARPGRKSKYSLVVTPILNSVVACPQMESMPSHDSTGAAFVFDLADCPCVDSPGDLVSWWPADDTAADVFGDNEGVFDGDYLDLGQVAEAFSFADTYVDCGSGSDVADLAIGTVEAWVFVSTGDNQGTVLGSELLTCPRRSRRTVGFNGFQHRMLVVDSVRFFRAQDKRTLKSARLLGGSRCKSATSRSRRRGDVSGVLRIRW